MESSSNIPSHNKHIQTEITQKTTQLKTILEYLKTNVATASMIEEATGIPQKNICRYKRDLETSNRLWEVVKIACKRTSFKAWYLTTNPDLAPQQNQLNLFDNG